MALQAKKLGKSLYILSADVQGGKVAHVNAVSPQLKSKGFDAREWANAVVQVVGGKVHYLSFKFSTTTNLFMNRLVVKRTVLRVSVSKSRKCKKLSRPPKRTIHNACKPS